MADEDFSEGADSSDDAERKASGEDGGDAFGTEGDTGEGENAENGDSTGVGNSAMGIGGNSEDADEGVKRLTLMNKQVADALSESDRVREQQREEIAGLKATLEGRQLHERSLRSQHEELLSKVQESTKSAEKEKANWTQKERSLKEEIQALKKGADKRGPEESNTMKEQIRVLEERVRRDEEAYKKWKSTAMEAGRSVETLRTSLEEAAAQLQGARAEVDLLKRMREQDAKGVEKHKARIKELMSGEAEQRWEGYRVMGRDFIANVTTMLAGLRTALQRNEMQAVKRYMTMLDEVNGSTVLDWNKDEFNLVGGEQEGALKRRRAADDDGQDEAPSSKKRA